MQEEFEKKIRERMHTFGIQPAHQVWDEIDAALNRQKHRRVFVGWWILLGLVLLGGAVLLFDKNNLTNNKLNQQPTLTNDTTNNNHLAQQPKTPGTGQNIPNQNTNTTSYNTQSTTAKDNKTNSTAAIAQNRLADVGQHPVALHDKSLFNIKSHLPAIVDKQNTAPQGKPGETASLAPQAGAKITPGNAESNIAINGDTGQLAALDKATGAMPAAPKQPLDTALVPAQPNETALNKTQPSTNAKTIANKTGKWFLTFSVGTSQTISHGAFNSAAASGLVSMPYTNYIYLPAITALGAYNNNINQPGLGFNISAGGMYEKQLSARWRISGGASVAYLSNTQKVGPVYKGSFYSLGGSNLNAGSAWLASLQSYFDPGTSGTVVNKAWQAQIPINAGYVFNPKGKTKFLLTGGVSVAWLLSSQWLIPDTRYNKLYYSNTILNNTAVNWQVGPAIECKNQWRFGLQYQQSFTTVAKNYVTPKLHWQNVNIYTAIPLTWGKKHK